MKTTKAITLILAGVLLSSCAQRFEEVPMTGRKPVPPAGSSGTEKSWNRPTEEEGKAMLGPLSDPR